MRRTCQLLLALLVLAASSAAAQTCNVNNPSGTCTTGNVTISNVTFPTVLSLTISGTTAALTAPTIGSFGPDSTATITDAALTSVVAAGNTGFHVTMRTTATNWTSSGTPPVPKPNSDLTWGTSPGGPFTSISTTPVTILSSASRSNPITVNLSFRTKWNFIQNTTGTYTLPLVFTLVSP